jgi:hypothetical protein
MILPVSGSIQILLHCSSSIIKFIGDKTSYLSKTDFAFQKAQSKERETFIGPSFVLSLSISSFETTFI